MTLTDLSDEHNRRDCLAELDRVDGPMRAGDWLAKWSEPLRQLLIEPGDSEDLDELRRSAKDAIEDVRNSLTDLENAL